MLQGLRTRLDALDPNKPIFLFNKRKRHFQASNQVRRSPAVKPSIAIKSNQKMKNENYKAANYAVDIEIAKSPNDVFNHIINLSKWWPEEFEGKSIELNTEFIFRTGDTH